MGPAPSAAQRTGLTWRDPAALIVLALVVIMGALLLTDRVVPDLLGTLLVVALGFLFGQHATSQGQGQVLAYLNGNAATALSSSVAAAKIVEAAAIGTPGGRRAADPLGPLT